MPRKTKAEIAREHVPHRLFDSFWTVYPRKVGKLDASLAFSRLDPADDLLAAMLSAIRIQERKGCLRRHPSKGLKFVPFPSSWLNQRRWEDEPDSDRTEFLDRGTSYARDTLLDALTPSGNGHVVTHAPSAGHAASSLPDAG